MIYELCGHPNKVVECPDHNWYCPDCGFGIGTMPRCHCNVTDPKVVKDEPMFGTHIKEAAAVIKQMLR